MLPTIALGIGVVVAGLGIGAFLSALQNKNGDMVATATTVPVQPVVTPVARPTRGPLARATAIPHPTSTPSATPLPRATDSPRPTSTPLPSSTPRATSTPRPTTSPRPTASPRPTETPRATASPQPAPTPRATAVPTLPPAPKSTPRAATPRPAARPTPAPVAPPTPLTFAGIAQNTVRRYIADLVAGNETAAYAELGKSPGDGNLAEEAFIDRSTRITSIRTTGHDATGATVEVELQSSRGSYYATYHVTNGPGAPVIDQHDYIKV